MFFDGVIIIKNGQSILKKHYMSKLDILRKKILLIMIFDILRIERFIIVMLNRSVVAKRRRLYLDRLMMG